MAERPTAAELVEAVREFLERDVADRLEGRVAFHVRVAINALGIVERELAGGAALDAAEQARLVALLSDDGDLESLRRGLAAAIRAGDLDSRRTELLEALRATTTERLAVTNPRYLGPDRSGGPDRSERPGDLG